jgi:hypothetical protein
MKIKENFLELEKVLKNYQNVIGIIIIALLILLSLMTYKNFDKQNEILETGGYTEGKIRCACTQEAWDAYVIQTEKLNFIEEKDYER